MSEGAAWSYLRAPRPPLATGSITLSMGLLAIGNGLLFAFVPVKLAAETEPHQQISAQAPLSADLAHQPPEE